MDASLVLIALLKADDPPINYGLDESDVTLISQCFGWEERWVESGWAPGTTDYESLSEMVTAEPAPFLRDISRYYGDDYYLEEVIEDSGYEDEDEDEDMDEMRVALTPQRLGQ